MKHLVVLVSLFFAVAAFADDAPAVSARQALDTAQKNITDRGLDKEIYIASVALTRPTFFGGETYWLVKYSHPLAAEGSNQQEIGIKIGLDGSVARVIRNLGSK